MFRDETVARHERELAELRNKLESERARAEKAEAEAAKARALAEETEAERKLRGGWFKQWLDRRAERKRNYDPYRPGIFSGFRRLSLVHILMGLGALLFAGFIILDVYHYCTDIQEGVVTGRDYHPPHTSCTTDSHGHTSCTTIPEHWTVDIAFQGQSATWSVSESEYNRIHYGDWFCYTDMFHSEDNCHGRP